jgi:hypothetical protein
LAYSPSLGGRCGHTDCSDLVRPGGGNVKPCHRRSCDYESARNTDR